MRESRTRYTKGGLTRDALRLTFGCWLATPTPEGCERIQKRRHGFTFTLESVERRCKQQPVDHVWRSGTASDACKNTSNKSRLQPLSVFSLVGMLAWCYFDCCHCLFMCFSFLTRLFETRLHPLGEPAQVTVTVQGVGPKSARGRRAVAVRTAICSLIHS